MALIHIASVTLKTTSSVHISDWTSLPMALVHSSVALRPLIPCLKLINIKAHPVHFCSPSAKKFIKSFGLRHFGLNHQLQCCKGARVGKSKPVCNFGQSPKFLASISSTLECNICRDWLRSLWDQALLGGQLWDLGNQSSITKLNFCLWTF